MMTFWILAALLIALALAMVLPALIKRAPSDASPDESATARHTTLAILRDQMTQLNAELARGSIDAEQHRVSREELERRVIEETSTGSSATGSAGA